MCLLVVPSMVVNSANRAKTHMGSGRTGDAADGGNVGDGRFDGEKVALGTLGVHDSSLVPIHHTAPLAGLESTLAGAMEDITERQHTFAQTNGGQGVQTSREETASNSNLVFETCEILKSGSGIGLRKASTRIDVVGRSQIQRHQRAAVELSAG